VSPVSPAPLADVGARADIVELVVAGTTTEAPELAGRATTALRTAGAPMIFVRLPLSATTSTTAATDTANAITARAPSVGIALPPGMGTTILSEVRTTTP
jgi:hypothetical protein